MSAPSAISASTDAGHGFVYDDLNTTSEVSDRTLEVSDRTLEVENRADTIIVVEPGSSVTIKSPNYPNDYNPNEV